MEYQKTTIPREGNKPEPTLEEPTQDITGKQEENEYNSTGRTSSSVGDCAVAQDMYVIGSARANIEENWSSKAHSSVLRKRVYDEENSESENGIPSTDPSKSALTFEQTIDIGEGDICGVHHVPQPESHQKHSSGEGVRTLSRIVYGFNSAIADIERNWRKNVLNSVCNSSPDDKNNADPEGYCLGNDLVKSISPRELSFGTDGECSDKSVSSGMQQPNLHQKDCSEEYIRQLAREAFGPGSASADIVKNWRENVLGSPLRKTFQGNEKFDAQNRTSGNTPSVLFLPRRLTFGTEHRRISGSSDILNNSSTQTDSDSGSLRKLVREIYGVGSACSDIERNWRENVLSSLRKSNVGEEEGLDDENAEHENDPDNLAIPRELKYGTENRGQNDPLTGDNGKAV